MYVVKGYGDLYGYMNFIVWGSSRRPVLAAKQASEGAMPERVCDPAAGKLPCRCRCAKGGVRHCDGLYREGQGSLLVMNGLAE